MIQWSSWSNPTGRQLFLAAVKSFVANIAISDNFVLNAKNSKVGYHSRYIARPDEYSTTDQLRGIPFPSNLI